MPHRRLRAAAALSLTLIALASCSVPITTAGFADTSAAEVTISAASAPSPATDLSVGEMNLATGTVTLTWKAGSGADRYEVTAEAGTQVGSYTATETSLDVPVVSGSTYSFRVEASNGFRAAPATATATPSTQPEVDEASGVSTTSVEASWQAVLGATSYQVDVSTNPSYPTSSTTTRTVTGTKATIDGLTPGMQYFLRVTAQASNGQESEPSDTHSAITTMRLLTVPGTVDDSRRRVAVDSSAGLAYISANLSKQLHVVDLETGQAQSRNVPSGTPSSVVVDQNTGTTYVSAAPRVYAYPRGASQPSLTLSPGRARNMIVHPVNGQVYVWDEGSGYRLVAYNRGSDQQAWTIDVPVTQSLGSSQMFITPNGRYILQTSSSSDHRGAVVLYDTLNRTVRIIDTGARGFEPYFASWVPDADSVHGGEFWMGGRGSEHVMRLSPGGQLALLDHEPFGGGSVTPAYHPPSGTVYVLASAKLWVVDPKTLDSDWVSLPEGASSLALDPETGRMYGYQNAGPVTLVELPVINLW